MKKIINGKVYDTSTAISVATWESDTDYRGLSHLEETLYRKKTGEYFLFGEGGPATKYAVSRGENNWASGEQIIPLPYDRARDWAEEHLSGEEYEAVFGPVVEDESKVSATFRLTVTTLEALKRKAAESGTGISEYLEAVLAKAL